MALSGTERLKRLYARFERSDHVLVMINADPDAIASAMAVKRLLWRRVSEVTITHVNVIERPDNLTMIRCLGVELVHVNDIDMNKYNRRVIVDSQADHHERFSTVSFDVVIDHHPVSSAQAPFVDIRPEYGATATILTEYLRAAKINPASKLATALFFAIKTDTANFERKTVMEDIRAFQFLYRFVDKPMAQRIEQGEIKYDFLKYFELALRRRKMRKGRIFVYLGPVSNPDVCVLIADFFMRVDAVRWSIVCGKYDKTLVVIFRNKGSRKHAANMAKNAFGQFGTAGGHKSMARAEFPLSRLSDTIDIKDDAAVQKWVMQQVLKGGVKNKP